jgi:hypothetical protein
MGVLTKGPATRFLKGRPVPRLAADAIGTLADACVVAEAQFRSLQRWLTGSGVAPESLASQRLREAHPEVYSLKPFVMTPQRQKAIEEALDQQRSSRP